MIKILRIFLNIDVFISLFSFKEVTFIKVIYAKIREVLTNFKN